MKLFKPLLVALAATMLLSSSSSAALTKAVGDVDFRFGPGPNDPDQDSMITAAAGVHAISYSGTLADLGFTADVDNARPFIGFDQNNDAVSGFAYLDNLVFSVDGNVVWSEDFEGATLGASSQGNNNLPDTVIQSANTLLMEVVAPPAGFTSGVGNVVSIGTTGNGFEAIRPWNNMGVNNIQFASVPNTAEYSISFDLFIVPEPSSLVLGLFGLGATMIRRRR